MPAPCVIREVCLSRVFRCRSFRSLFVVWSFIFFAAIMFRKCPSPFLWYRCRRRRRRSWLSLISSSAWRGPFDLLLLLALPGLFSGCPLVLRARTHSSTVGRLYTLFSGYPLVHTLQRLPACTHSSAVARLCTLFSGCPLVHTLQRFPAHGVTNYVNRDTRLKLLALCARATAQS